MARTTVLRDRLTAAARHRRALDALTVFLGIGGLTLVVVGAAPPPAPTRAEQVARAPSRSTAQDEAAAQEQATATAGTPPSGAPRAPRALGASVPVRLEIPAIRVDTALMELGLNADGTVAVPPLRAKAPAGWYRNLRTPGETGPSVILGHVDTAAEGPAVFYRLRELRPGDTATVRRADGSSATFTVESVVAVPKPDFPTDDVYGPVAYPALRLVTCGGTFDRLHRSYRGNIVVSARLTATG
ncbi:class F sortase [Dactylosporangium roseum]|uniref:Class F sortase n=1 Tax=Dactylosporangium roseum TaxID=47989 RepID=A0ABY5YWF9_9ACTN|nr:class F sortase [Dactylosporangium roseum]UWZ34088.1 class F sortase [Dactylosporangium roseum]